MTAGGCAPATDARALSTRPDMQHGSNVLGVVASRHLQSYTALRHILKLTYVGAGKIRAMPIMSSVWRGCFLLALESPKRPIQAVTSQQMLMQAGSFGCQA
jgi:hypothetical protein